MEGEGASSRNIFTIERHTLLHVTLQGRLHYYFRIGKAILVNVVVSMN